MAKGKIGELDVVLKPSKIEGIGVFANKDLAKGSRLSHDEKTRIIKVKEAKKNKKLYEKCERYCVETKKGYICPLSFQVMSAIWFLNHSKKPNLVRGKKYWIAKKSIKEGEELTVDYRDLDVDIPNAEYMGEKL